PTASPDERSTVSPNGLCATELSSALSNDRDESVLAHELTSPSLPPPKVKLSLKDFALRKKKQRQEEQTRAETEELDKAGAMKQETEKAPVHVNGHTESAHTRAVGEALGGRPNVKLAVDGTIA